jgi:glucose-1-phosphate thymidylyltransferase
MVSSAVLVAQADSPHVPDEPSVAYGYDRPLALMSVLNRPLILHVVDDLVALGVNRVVVVVDRRIAGPVATALTEAVPESLSLGFLERGRSLPLLKAIARARRRLDPGAFLLGFADYLCRGELGPRLVPGWELGDNDAVVLVSRFAASPEAAAPPQGEEEGEEEPVGPAGGEGTVEDLAGLFLLGAGFPSAVKGPEETLLLPTVATALDQMETAGGRVERRLVGDWWRYRGQPNPILEMNQFKLAGLEAQPCSAEVADSDLEGPVECDPTARIYSSVVRGPAVVGPHAEIRDAFVGPYTSIGAHVRIEGAEVENSVILEGSSITHVGSRLDSSVIGPRARIFRDFRIPRGTRINAGPGASISLE